MSYFFLLSAFYFRGGIQPNVILSGQNKQRNAVISFTLKLALLWYSSFVMKMLMYSQNQTVVIENDYYFKIKPISVMPSGAKYSEMSIKLLLMHVFIKSL